MKIAIDNQIASYVVDALRRKYDVVLTAGNMSDEEWIEKALDLGATVFCSPDLDVPNYLQQYDLPYIWIDIPQGLKRHRQFPYLDKRLRELK